MTTKTQPKPGDMSSPSLRTMQKADYEYAIYPEATPERDFWLGGGGPQYDPASLPRNQVPRIPWGKHRGKRVEQVPRDYFEWCEEKGIHFQGELKDAIDQRLGRTVTVESAP